MIVLYKHLYSTLYVHYSTIIYCLAWPWSPRQLCGAFRGGAWHRLSRGSSHRCHRFHFHASLGGTGGLVIVILLWVDLDNFGQLMLEEIQRSKWRGWNGVLSAETNLFVLAVGFLGEDRSIIWGMTGRLGMGSYRCRENSNVSQLVSDCIKWYKHDYQ